MRSLTRLLPLFVLCACARAPADAADAPLLGDGARRRGRRATAARVRTSPSRRPRRLQQLPWTAAHEKLLTAFAGDALPDVCQLGNTWMPEFAALGALENPACARRCIAVDRAADYFPGIWDTNVIDGQLYGVPWYVDTRLALLPHATCWRRQDSTRPRARGRSGQTALAAIKRTGRSRIAMRSCCRSTNSSRCWRWPAASRRRCCATTARRGNFRSADFKRALAFYREMFDNGWAPAHERTQISNVWDEFGRGHFRLLHLRAVEHRRIQAPSAAGACRRLDDRAAAGAGGSGRVDRRRLQPCGLPLGAARKMPAWKLIEYLVRA